MLRSLGAPVNPPFCGSNFGGRLALAATGAGDPADLAAWLRTRHLGRSSVYHEVIGSTQDEARKLAARGAPHGMLVWAGAQSAGRGRMSRQWQSEAGAGLWFSVVLRPGVAAERVAPLPMVCGGAVGAALDQLAPGRIKLKWPNDVLLEGRKVAGILVEGHAAGSTIDHVVVGVGVNLSRPADGFAPAIQETAVAMADATVQPPAAARTLASILGRLEDGYEELIADGPGAARARWLEMADTIGREVRAQVAGQTLQGTGIDLDPNGNLVLRLADGSPQVITYGEIEHLR